MKNKRSIIIKIILLSIVAILLIGLLIFGLIGSKYGFVYMSFFNFKSSVVYENTFSIEEISSIQVDTTSSDLRIKNHDEKDIKVVIYDKNDKFLKVDTENNKLSINNKGENFCIGFCYTKRVVEIYLPNDNTIFLALHSTSGDIKVDALLQQLSIIATSGNVEVDKANDIQIKTSSGNIKVGDSKIVDLEASSGNIRIGKSKGGKIQTSSGNIRIDVLEAIQNSTITANSGNVRIDYVNDIYISANASSGNIQVRDSNRFSEIELSITTKSGNIKVK